MEIYKHIQNKDLERTWDYVTQNPDMNFTLENDAIFELICESGDFEKATIFTDSGYDVDFDRMFHKICGYGDIHFAKWFYSKYNCTIYPSDHSDNNGNCDGFCQACENGYIEMVIWIFEAFPNIDITIYKSSSFVNACKNGHLRIANILYNKFTSVQKIEHFNDAFYNACNNNKLEIATWLFNINSSLLDVKQALIDTCEMGHITVAKWLMDQARIFGIICAKDVLHIFCTACYTGNCLILLWIIDIDIDNRIHKFIANNRNSLFIQICKTNNVFAVTWFVQLYDDKNALDWESAMVSACRCGSLSLARYIKSNMVVDCFNVNNLGNNIFWDINTLCNLNMAKWVYSNTNKIEISNEKTQCPKYFANRLLKIGKIEAYKWIMNIFSVLEDIELYCDAFNCACEMGNIHLAKFAISQCSSMCTSCVLLEELLVWWFIEMCCKNNSKMIKFIFTKINELNINVPPSKIRDCFEKACISGNLQIAKWVLSQFKTDNIQVARTHTHIFQKICNTGNSKTAMWYLANYSEHIQICDDNNLAFRNACKRGHIEIAQQIIELNKHKAIEIILDVDPIVPHINSFVHACRNNRQKLTEWMYSINSDVSMIISNNDYIFRTIRSVAKNSDYENYRHIIEWIVSMCPDRYRITYEEEYDYILDWVIVTQFTLLPGVTIRKNIENCPICYEQQCNIISDCNHAFCEQCITKVHNIMYGNADVFICPICRNGNTKFSKLVIFD